MRALVLFASEEGQTDKIAKRIAAGLSQYKIPCDTFHVADDRHAPIAIDSYDAVIVGSPIHYSHYDPRLADYLREYHQALNQIPTAFFSVSLGILSDKDDERADVQRISDVYLSTTGWNPEMRLHFGGAIAYSKYGLIKRHLLHWIAKKEGTETNMSRDYEFTDWEQVDQFVKDFAQFVESCKQPDANRRRCSPYADPVRPIALRHRKTRDRQKSFR